MRTTPTTIPRFDSNERRANARSLCAVVVLLKGAPQTPLSARADKKISPTSNPLRNDYWIHITLRISFSRRIINEHETKPTRRIQTIKNAPVIGGRLLPPGGQTCTPGGKRARFGSKRSGGHDFLIFFFFERDTKCNERLCGLTNKEAPLCVGINEKRVARKKREGRAKRAAHNFCFVAKFFFFVEIYLSLSSVLLCVVCCCG